MRRKFVVLQVSTHGYSQNQILVWKYPSLTQVAKLTGHSYRVLYLVSKTHSSQINEHVKSPPTTPDFPHTNCDSPLYSASNNEFYTQAMSPDGEAIVTGAGDETLRFWNVFSKMRSTKVSFSLTFLPCIYNHGRVFFFFLIPADWGIPVSIFLSFRNLCQCWTSSPGYGSMHTSVRRGSDSRKGLYLCMCRAVNKPLVWVSTSVHPPNALSCLVF